MFDAFGHPCYPPRKLDLCLTPIRSEGLNQPAFYNPSYGGATLVAYSRGISTPPHSPTDRTFKLFENE